mgnify:CR=1 FL=1
MQNVCRLFPGRKCVAHHPFCLAFPSLPSVASPRTLTGGPRAANTLLARDGAGTPLPPLVPQVDTDGNELGGLRLPEIAVPLGPLATAVNSTELFAPVGFTTKLAALPPTGKPCPVTVSVTTVETMKKTPGFSTRPGLCERPAAMPNDCTIASATVR